MAAAHRRHDLSDKVWEQLRPYLPGGAGKRGRPARDNRLFLNAVFWILRTGAPWRTCRRITGTGRTPIDAFAGGETAVSGTNCWSGSSKIRTLSG